MRPRISFKIASLINNYDLQFYSNAPFTIDDFVAGDRYYQIQRASNSGKFVDIDHREALKSVRKKNHSPTCLRVPLSEIFETPDFVKESSLFERFWPCKEESNFFVYKHKVFYYYQKKFTCPAKINYGGLSGWLYVIEGKLELKLTLPSEKNLLSLEHLIEGETFTPEPKTQGSYLLETGSLLTIPAGWIVETKAKRNTRAVGGGLLHEEDMRSQLEAFDRAIIVTCDKHVLTRDREIRALLWFYASQTISKNLENCKLDINEIEYLAAKLDEWRTLQRKRQLPPAGVYVPEGLQGDLFLSELKRRVREFKRRSIKKPSESQ